MKKFIFDDAGNLSVRTLKNCEDAEGNLIGCIEQHDIQASQLKAHLPMFAADMSKAELAEANTIISAQ